MLIALFLNVDLINIYIRNKYRKNIYKNSNNNRDKYNYIHATLVDHISNVGSCNVFCCFNKHIIIE